MDCIEATWKKAKALRKRSRQLLAFAVFTAALSHTEAYGQTFSEWFKQKKTQKQYLLQQISALMTYRRFASDGYQIAKGGLGSIGRYVGQEYDLHSDHYQRLKTVNTAIKSDPQVKTILSRQHDILALTSQAKVQNGLTPNESSYIKKVCAALIEDCDGLLNDLQTVVNDNKVTMSDEERLRQIGRICRSMQDNYRFAQSFNDQLKLYMLQKDQQQKDVNTIKQWYGKVD
ncbi:hypothetical protein INP83_06880 [Mucilaginibacter sp. 21P]|uniref:hypothetical protein n=1 Tax=Mucilaginibacter sp. 21P TaxID=2778902 RepID=UPI001C591B48|nr:hypothetical protein [Mucilaginibacter sp. 21P]QXV66803.1 hypothetical protein INP83_06880 [Mucilaginibacter sp. 21P]